MGLARRLRISLAATLAIAASAAIAAPAALADHPLRPDLVTLGLEQNDLVMAPAGEKGNGAKLRLTNEVGNQGVGPLEIFPGGVTETCRGNANLEVGRLAFQRIFTDGNDSNVFERGTDTEWQSSGAGCMQYHPAPGHNHWHVLDFAKYSLLKEKNGNFAASGGKVGFCLVDTRTPFDSNPPGTPASAEYDNCAATEAAPPGLEGISVGWSDIYSSGTPGQRIKVSGLDRGKYCLLSEADPTGLLDETADANNTTEARIRMNPRQLKVEKLGNDCAATR